MLRSHQKWCQTEWRNIKTFIIPSILNTGSLKLPHILTNTHTHPKHHYNFFKATWLLSPKTSTRPVFILGLSGFVIYFPWSQPNFLAFFLAGLGRGFSGCFCRKYRKGCTPLITPLFPQAIQKFTSHAWMWNRNKDYRHPHSFLQISHTHAVTEQ